MDLPASDQNLREVDADIAVVGYGPVGMVVAALLGRRGHRVVVLEKYPGLYNLPRAGVFDDETMRTFAALGVADQLLPNLIAPQRYWFQNGAGARVRPKPRVDRLGGQTLPLVLFSHHRSGYRGPGRRRTGRLNTQASPRIHYYAFTLLIVDRRVCPWTLPRPTWTSGQ